MNRREFVKSFALSFFALPLVNFEHVSANLQEQESGMIFPFMFSEKQKTTKPTSVAVTKFNATNKTWIERLFAWLN